MSHHGSSHSLIVRLHKYYPVATQQVKYTN